MTDILIIEDNRDLGQLIADFLKREGWTVTLAQSGEEGLERLENEAYKLLLLDVMLPGKDGFETLSRIRESRDMPVLMMSARTDDDSKILGLEIGADDYVDKPFSIPVLTSKIKALMRRTYDVKGERQIISAYGLTLDIDSRTAYKNNEPLELNVKEFDLLLYFMENQGKALKKDEIFDAVWGVDCYSELSSLTVYISRLRERIEDDPKAPSLIKTVYRIGYQFGESR
ncbi:MAG: response regulator transcription factor [Oscillospiraceae bacterium]|nr:response regulator transcription factor [Oscillospiraceae bacterium]MBQ8979226.1 response regulator transcription factor [Oscillospiraceae bacterium]